MRLRKDRLMTLVNILRADAKNKKGLRFDLKQWGSVRNVLGTLAMDCGTQGCALGAAALSGVFAKDGLDYERGCVSIRFIWRGRHRGAIDTAMELFGISYEAANYLFLPSYYKRGPITGAKGERRVANRIAAFVRSGGNIPDKYT